MVSPCLRPRDREAAEGPEAHTPAPEPFSVFRTHILTSGAWSLLTYRLLVWPMDSMRGGQRGRRKGWGMPSCSLSAAGVEQAP